MKRKIQKSQGLKLDKSILQKIKKYQDNPSISSTGLITKIGDGVAYVDGLSDVMMGEMVFFDKGTYGLALNLTEDSVGIVLLGDNNELREGDSVRTTGEILSTPVGENMLGRVVDGLGRPIDGLPAPEPAAMFPLEHIAPGVLSREKVNKPVQTGVLAIDSMIPIGRGQRELIIGDRGVGKSAIALTTIINQKNEKMFCIYVAIGQKRSYVAQLVNTLEEFGAMEYSIVVAGTASDPAAMQYLAPYAATAMGEYFAQKGQDALIVYDDLSKHAWAYRELSLLLRRPSGREAYPGDVFYLHSRLLERSVNLNKKFGGGSLTALPIIETQAGDVSAYIPTNVISITDGQIYLEADLFHAGFKPAVNAGKSVSRVGGDAQIKAMKQVAGKLRLELAQYREMAAFAQFASDLDDKTRAQLDKGERLSEILKQGWDAPVSVESQIILIWAVTEGYADTIPTDKMREWKDRLLDYIETEGRSLVSSIKSESKLTDKIIKNLGKFATKFKDVASSLEEVEEE